MAFSQLTPLFLDLNMPAILDLLFLIYKRPATARNLSLQLWPQEPVFTILATTRLCTLYLPHKPATTAAGVCCRNAQHKAVWIKVFNLGIIFFPSYEKNFFSKKFFSH